MQKIRNSVFHFNEECSLQHECVEAVHGMLQHTDCRTQKLDSAKNDQLHQPLNSSKTNTKLTIRKNISK